MFEHADHVVGHDLKMEGELGVQVSLWYKSLQKQGSLSGSFAIHLSLPVA